MLNIAILGFGVVGSGVYDVIVENGTHIASVVGDNINVKYILDRKNFAPECGFADKVVLEFDIILRDPNVDVIVEVMGGTTSAYEFTKKSLLSGRSVVTSNKELVSMHGTELFDIARQNKVHYLFEASVGGGIPIIRPLMQCLSSNKINGIYGILNGTTNYILSRMCDDNITLDAALTEAQEKGYAERDPSSDINGDDSARKICILSSIAFGKYVSPEYIPVEGIGDINIDDIKYANILNKSIKLIAMAYNGSDGIGVCVAPHLVHKDSPIYGVGGVFNAIVVNGNAVGDVMFYGSGAGKLPTASAIVADIIDILKGRRCNDNVPWSSDEVRINHTISEYFVRVSGVSLDSITSKMPDINPLETTLNGEFAFITPKIKCDELEDFLNYINPSFKRVMRIL